MRHMQTLDNTPTEALLLVVRSFLRAHVIIVVARHKNVVFVLLSTLVLVPLSSTKYLSVSIFKYVLYVYIYIWNK